ncbi:MAG: SpoIID/LytB domain-containing protein [Defluviitaleaceae bacterium]|nr:SpoIID/LytB domain-containing protein [Defluviitaleaceae bacterium]
MRKNFFLWVVLAAAFVMLPTMTVFAHYYEESDLVRIGLLRSFSNRESINIANTNIFAGYGTESGFMPVQELYSAGGFTARAQGNQVQLMVSGQVVHTFTGTGAQIMDVNGYPITLGAYSYRGAIEFRPYGGRISAINVLSIEEYLYGVLPSEMSPGFHIEALKAQAVASRTFAQNSVNQGRHRAQGFDLCDGTHCQVYRGVSLEHENTTRAVRETHGLMLFYNDSPILAVYFSSSGGATDNSEDVWFEARPYLRSVNEIHEHEPMVWTRTFTWQQLTTAAANANAGIGTVNGISVSGMGASGRANALTLYGTGGSWTVTREERIRGFFSAIGGTLPSSNFTIAGGLPTTQAVNVTSGWQDLHAPLNTLQALDSNGAISTVHMAYIFDGHSMRRLDSTPTVARGGSGITIEGRGWGHGVGMSQRGAYGMARMGFCFREILLHYYTGVEIR